MAASTVPEKMKLTPDPAARNDLAIICKLRNCSVGDALGHAIGDTATIVEAWANDSRVFTEGPKYSIRIFGHRIRIGKVRQEILRP